MNKRRAISCVHFGSLAILAVGAACTEFHCPEGMRLVGASCYRTVQEQGHSDSGIADSGNLDAEADHRDAESMRPDASDVSRECADDGHCPAERPVCSAQGACFRCDSSEQCEWRSQVCDPAVGACVECTAIAQENCLTLGKVCYESASRCTECNSAAQCNEAEPRCNAQGECDVCASDEDCAPFGKVCDSGQCVECTGAKAQGCNGFVCNSKLRQCANGISPGTADYCETCISDAHCGLSGPSLCMQETFEGQTLGYVCLPKQGEGVCIYDRVPFAGATVDIDEKPVPSIDGSTEVACRLRATTCESLRDYSSKSCGSLGNDAVCGNANLPDGKCAKVPNQNAYYCSTTCLASADCNLGRACLGAGYCSF